MPGVAAGQDVQKWCGLEGQPPRSTVSFADPLARTLQRASRRTFPAIVLVRFIALSRPAKSQGGRDFLLQGCVPILGPWLPAGEPPQGHDGPETPGALRLQGHTGHPWVSRAALSRSLTLSNGRVWQCLTHSRSPITGRDLHASRVGSYWAGSKRNTGTRM